MSESEDRGDDGVVRVISPDDHIVEPPHLWQTYVPRALRDRAPRVERRRGRSVLRGGSFVYDEDDSVPPGDVWIFDGTVAPIPRASAAVGLELEAMDSEPTTFDEMRPGCYDPVARLRDMDAAGIEASVCFPNDFTRFCGQRFLHCGDRDLALACVRAYNEFVIGEWCADSRGRLVPLCIIPLWDPELAAEEVRRSAKRGVRAVCFSELPTYLRLPSITSGDWDPFFAACNETGTVLMMHIGSGSRLPSPSLDAAPAVASTAASMNSCLSVLDWLFSGKLLQFSNIRLCYAEAQAGWLPYYLERADRVWEHNRGWNQVYDKIPERPSSYAAQHIYTTVFSDKFGLDNIDLIGAENVMFECDYPHSDSNWPHTASVGADMTAHLSRHVARGILRDNAAKLFGVRTAAESRPYSV